MATKAQVRQEYEAGGSVKETTEDTTSKIFLSGVLIDLKCAYWRGKRPLVAQDLGLTDQQVPDIFTLGRKLVIPKDALARFDRINARAYFLIDQFTFPFPTGHARFVPYSVLPEVLAELKKLEERFTEETREFLEKYDEYRAEFIARYPQYAEALSRGYEAASDLKKRYHFNYTLYEVRLPREVRFKALQERDALADVEAQRQALTRASAEYQAQFGAQLDEFLNSSVGKLREAVAESVVKLSERMKKGDSITKTSLESLKTTIERFRSLNFVGDASVEQQLDALEALIPTSSERFKEEVFKNAFSNALESVQGAIKSDITSATGEYKRRLKLD